MVYHHHQVTRPWRGQLANSAGETFEYYLNEIDETMVSLTIRVTAAIEREMFSKLVTFTTGAFSQIEAAVRRFVNPRAIRRRSEINLEQRER